MLKLRYQSRPRTTLLRALAAYVMVIVALSLALWPILWAEYARSPKIPGFWGTLPLPVMAIAIAAILGIFNVTVFGLPFWLAGHLLSVRRGVAAAVASVLIPVATFPISLGLRELFIASLIGGAAVFLLWTIAYPKSLQPNPPPTSSSGRPNSG